MKMHKITSLILLTVISVMLCGCDIDTPDDLSDQASSLAMILYHTNTTKVDKEHYEFADSCFSDIEIFGAKLALPMNVSDLPDEFTIDSHSQGSVYNGYYIDRVSLLCDEKETVYAEIMYPVGKEQSDGQIVAIECYNFILADDAVVYLGGEYDFMSIDDVIEHFGECEKGDYMIYDLGDGRSIRFDYLYSYGNTPDADAFTIRLDTINKIW